MSNAEDQKFALKMVSIVFVGLVLIAATIIGGIILHDRQMIKAGFHIERIPSTVGEYWAK